MWGLLTFWRHEKFMRNLWDARLPPGHWVQFSKHPQAVLNMNGCFIFSFCRQNRGGVCRSGPVQHYCLTRYSETNALHGLKKCFCRNYSFQDAAWRSNTTQKTFSAAIPGKTEELPTAHLLLSRGRASSSVSDTVSEGNKWCSLRHKKNLELGIT